MEHRLHNVVMARLDAIANAEKITRHELGHLSREALVYVTDTQDIDFINRLLGVLTPVNKRVAILYFSHFLPWEQEKDTDDKFQRFGKKMLGEKKLAKRKAAMNDWLADEANNIWSWAADNVSVDKVPDYKARVTSSIKAALAGNTDKGVEPVSPLELLVAIFDGGFKLDDMLTAAGAWADIRAKQEEEAMATMAKDVTPAETQEEVKGIAA